MQIMRSKWFTIICLLGITLALGYFHLYRNDTPVLENIKGVEAMFYEKLSENKVQCNLCFRNCVIDEGERGFCRNRENRGGYLYTLVYGQASAIQIDPVEKEPMHHFLPGENILCIGTASCNFRCKFCHNWHMSQRSIEEIRYRREITPEQIVDRALQNNIPAISFTYNEPTVFYEYMYDTAKLAQQKGLKVIFHTNASINAEPLRKLLKYIDGVTVDLKGFNNQYYQDLTQGELETVLETLKIIKEEEVWLEIVNLILPGLNDDPEDIREMSDWIYENLGADVPLHFSRFFPSYRLQDLAPTPVATLEEAAEIASQQGLNYISIGNVPGHLKNSTFCKNCEKEVISRYHFSVTAIYIDERGICDNCGQEIPGVWE